MASDFDFTLEDLMSNDPAPFVFQQNKHLATGQPLRTTRSTLGIDQRYNLSTLSLGQAMMNIPLFGDVTDTLQKQELLLTGALGAILGQTGSGDDKSNGSLGAGFDDFIPNMLKSAADLARQSANLDQAGGGELGPPPGATGDNTSGTITDGSQLVANTARVHFQNSKGAEAAKNDLAAGKIAPNVVRALAVMTTQLEITISCAMTDLNGNYAQGHATGSLHYDGRAVDVAELRDPVTGEYVHINGPHRLVQRALDLLGTLLYLRSDGEIISPINPGFGPRFWSDANHQNHIHVGCRTRGVDAPTPIKGLS